MNLKITTSGTLSVPTGTKVITNDEWVTLAKKDKTGKVSILTCLATDIHQQELHEENNWLVLTKKELEAISKL